MDCSLPGFPVQARILEWVAIPFSRGSSWPRDLPDPSPTLQTGYLPSEPPDILDLIISINYSPSSIVSISNNSCFSPHFQYFQFISFRILTSQIFSFDWDHESIHFKVSPLSAQDSCLINICWVNNLSGCIHITFKVPSAQAWCTGKTQRNRVEREVGGGIRMGNTCKSMADSCQCMTKTTTIL